MRVVVLGASGMLGHIVAQVLEAAGLNIIRVSRTSEGPWDAHKQGFNELAERLNLNGGDWLVNCVGWIPQKSSGDDRQDYRNSARLNSSLLREISEAQVSMGFGWIQIGTDCVFDGGGGPYSEVRSMDAADTYGASKVAGEQFTSSSMLIRTSIVGPDVANRSGLFEWFRTLPRNSVVPGFSNQLWNGVSTLVFARLAAGLIVKNQRAPIRQHFVPLGFVSKYELLCLFREVTGRSDIEIRPTEAPVGIDRRLLTIDPAMNERLWRIAGYSRPQTIEEMCLEFGVGIVER